MDMCEITEQCARPEQEKIRVRYKNGWKEVIKGERINYNRLNKPYCMTVVCLYPFTVKEGVRYNNERWFPDVTPAEYLIMKEKERIKLEAQQGKLNL